MRGERQRGVTDTLDVRLLGLGEELPRLRSQLIRSLRALAQLLLHRTGEPLILLMQHRPRFSCHEASVPDPPPGFTRLTLLDGDYVLYQAALPRDRG